MMGCNDLNDEHNWPASVFSSKETNIHEHSIRNSWDTEGRSAFTPNFFGPDLLPSNHLTQTIGNSIWEHTNRADHCAHVPEADVKLMANFLKLDGLQSLQMAPNAEYPVTNMAPNLRLPNIEVQPLQMYESDKGSDNTTAKRLHDGSFFSYHIEEPMLHFNASSTGNNISGSTQTTGQAREGKIISANRLRNSSKTGCRVSEDVASSEAIDGSFLTLGTGKGTVANPERQFSNREPASKINDDFHPRIKRAHIQPGASSFPTPTCNPGYDVPSIRKNANAWSNISDYSGGRIAHNNAGTFSAAQTGLRTTPLHGVSIPQAGMYQDFGANRYGNLGHSANVNGTVAESFPYNRHQGFPAAQPPPFSETFSCLSQFESAGFSKPGSSSSSPAWFATQALLNHSQKSATPPAINTSSGSANSYRFPPLGGISSSQYFGGQVAPHKVEPIQASKSSSTGRIQFQAMSSAPDALFPKRLAGHPGAGVAQAVVKGGFHRTQDSANARFPTDHSGPSVPLGGFRRTQDSTNARFPTDHSGPSVLLDMGKTVTSLATISDDLPLAKRKAAAPVIPSSSQRRKISPLQAGEPSSLPIRRIIPFSGSSHAPSTNPSPIMSPAPGSIHVPPPAPLYIRREGNQGKLQPVGHNCLLCKRDLSFQPEGPVTQPSTPPVAVLPCGHVFHDHCLQIITPEDQLNNPPCIPCAMGES